MTFELTVTCQLPAETMGEAVTIIEQRIRSAGKAAIRLSAVSGKVVPDPKGKDPQP